MIWLWIYRAVMGCYLLFIAYILSDFFPQVFGNPIIGIFAIGVFGLLMIFKPWQEPKPLNKWDERRSKDDEEGASG